jgi:CO dehydrogenase maturation factor
MNTRANAGHQVIAVGGKGGVGKTAVSAITIKLLLQTDVRLLVIDADPVISLTYALGETPRDTIGRFRERVIEIPDEKRALRDRPIKDSMRDFVQTTGRGYDLLVMGRAEGPGCFCGLNDLLRHGIETLVKDYAVSIVDCEAGIEQVNRRSVHKIDRLLLVTDTSQRGLETVRQVREIAEKYNDGHSIEALLLVNRLAGEDEKKRIRSLMQSSDPEVIGWLPEDPNIREFNLMGKPLVDLPDRSPSVLVMRDILKRIALPYPF